MIDNYIENNNAFVPFAGRLKNTESSGNDNQEAFVVFANQVGVTNNYTNLTSNEKLEALSDLLGRTVTNNTFVDILNGTSTIQNIYDQIDSLVDVWAEPTITEIKSGENYENHINVGISGVGSKNVSIELERWTGQSGNEYVNYTSMTTNENTHTFVDLISKSNLAGVSKIWYNVKFVYNKTQVRYKTFTVSVNETAPVESITVTANPALNGSGEIWVNKLGGTIQLNVLSTVPFKYSTTRSEVALVGGLELNQIIGAGSYTYNLTVTSNYSKNNTPTDKAEILFISTDNPAVRKTVIIYRYGGLFPTVDGGKTVYDLVSFVNTGGTTTVLVKNDSDDENNNRWTVSSDLSWCHAEKGDEQNIIITADPHYSGGDSAVVMARVGSMDDEFTATVTVSCPSKSQYFSIQDSAHVAKESGTVDESNTNLVYILSTNLNPWTAASDSQWCTISPSTSNQSETGITIACNSNDTSSNRTATITFTCTEGITRTFEVIQKPTSATTPIVVESDFIKFGPNSSEKMITVTSETVIDNVTGPEWCTYLIASDGKSIAVRASEIPISSSGDRSGTIILYSGSLSKSIEVTLFYELDLRTNTEKVVLPLELDVKIGVLNNAEYAVAISGKSDNPSLYDWISDPNVVNRSEQIGVVTYNSYISIHCKENLTNSNRTATLNIRSLVDASKIIKCQIIQRPVQVAFYNKTSSSSSGWSYIPVMGDGSFDQNYTGLVSNAVSFDLSMYRNYPWTSITKELVDEENQVVSGGDTSWVTITPGELPNTKITSDGYIGIGVSFTENTSTSARKCKMTVKCGGKDFVLYLGQRGSSSYISASKTSINTSYNAKTSQSVLISSNVNWLATKSVDWITFVTSSGSNGQYVVYNIAENTSTTSRTGTITVKQLTTVGSDLSNIANPVTIIITQAGAPSFSISPTYLDYFSADGESKTITVTTNESSWNASADESWISITKNNNILTITVSKNEDSASRGGWVTITSGDLSKDVSIFQEAGVAPSNSITLSRASDAYYSNRDIQLTIDSSGNATFTLPGTYAQDLNFTLLNVTTTGANMNGYRVIGTSGNDGDWITDLPSQANNNNAVFSFGFKENTSQESRTVVVTIQRKGDAFEFNNENIRTITITQLGASSTTPSQPVVGDKIYYGQSTSNVLETMKTAVLTNHVDITSNSTYSFNVTVEDEGRVLIAVPTSNDITTIKAGGQNATISALFNKDSIQINSVNYYLYSTKSQYEASTFNMEITINI